MSVHDPSVHRLLVWATIGEAALAIAKEWKTLLKAIAVPAMIVAGVNVVFPEGLSLLALPLMVLSGVFGMMIAISCHRLVLLGPDALPSALGLFWTERETRFLGRSVGLMLISGGLVSLGLVLIGGLVFGAMLAVGVSPAPLSTSTRDFLVVVFMFALGPVFLPVAYVSARLSLVLPATAIGQHLTFKDSWRLSRSHGWRLALVLFLPGFFLMPLSLGGSLLLPGGVLQYLSALVMGLGFT